MASGHKLFTTFRAAPIAPGQVTDDFEHFIRQRCAAKHSEAYYSYTCSAQQEEKRLEPQPARVGNHPRRPLPGQHSSIPENAGPVETKHYQTAHQETDSPSACFAKCPNQLSQTPGWPENVSSALRRKRLKTSEDAELFPSVARHARQQPIYHAPPSARHAHLYL